MTIVGEDCTDIMLDENGQPLTVLNSPFSSATG